MVGKPEERIKSICPPCRRADSPPSVFELKNKTKKTVQVGVGTQFTNQRSVWIDMIQKRFSLY